jgi:molecular chaperone DnaK
MSNTINLGIDLGTTNSSIAVCRNGEVEIFKNPSGMKPTLPSVVAFRKGRTLVGDKAREYVEKDPQNVVGRFKRKMGTDEKYFIPNLGENLSPTDLSAYVLEELRRFVYTGETYPSVVITIPAAFDTVQSNATKQAGYRAGFVEVALLQEPIAASLAFANKQKTEDPAARRIVYDLGGGTFDAALVHIADEMTVIDHEGDNFFGGMDFDSLIVERIIVPRLQAEGKHPGIERLRSAGSPYNSLYYQLLHRAEELKIALSSHESADLEAEVDDDEYFYTVSREEFEALIAEHIRRSIETVRQLLDRNSLAPHDIREVILIGGSTYIPLVRRMIAGELGVPVNTSVDPTTAVVVGAAFYASSKTAAAVKNDDPEDSQNAQIYVKTGYAKHSRDTEEYFSAAVTPENSVHQYRIVRKDGGFDTGFRPFAEKIGEKLPLLPQTLNQFELSLYDRRGHRIPAHVPTIEIVQGQFSIQGQPLPNDICIEVDDTDNRSTLLDVIFEKNTILPVRRTVIKTVSRTMTPQSGDRLLINVLEGNRYASPGSCTPVGIIEIKADDMNEPLVKGCDIELGFEMSESRDLKITAYITGVDREITRVFSPDTHVVHMPRVAEELTMMLKECKSYLNSAVRKELYEESGILKRWEDEIEDLRARAARLTDDDVTDEKYAVERQKRKLSVELDLYKSNHMAVELKEEYYDLKSQMEKELHDSKDETLRRRFQSLTLNENSWLRGSPTVIRAKLRDMRSLHYDMQKSNFSWVMSLYLYYSLRDESEFSDSKQLNLLKEQATEAIAQQNAAALLSIVNYMYALLIDSEDNDAPVRNIPGMGIE